MTNEDFLIQRKVVRSIVRLLLAALSVILIWLQLMSPLSEGRITGIWFGIVGLLIALFVVVWGSIDSRKDAESGRRIVAWFLGAPAVHVIVALAASPLVFRWMASKGGGGGGSADQGFGFVVQVYVTVLVAPVAVIPISAVVTLMIAAGVAHLKRRNGLRAADDAMVPYLILLIAGGLYLSTTQMYRPRERPVPAAVDPDGRRLMTACGSGDFGAAHRLLDEGSPANTVHPTGFTPLIAVVLSRPFPPGSSPAFESEQLRLVDRLIKAGADVSVRDPHGKTALDHAEQRNLTAISERLRRK